MKESKYNIWLDNDNEKRLCFNTESLGFAEFDDNAINLISKVVDGILIDDLTDYDKTLLTELEKGKILVEDEHDIIQEMKLNYYMNTYGSRSFSYTILPTLQCNFDCTYCFEANKDQRMDDSVVESLKLYIKKTIDSKNPKFLSINWFGGEPLLEYDRIRDLSKFFIGLANKNSIGYYSEMISNCWLLTPEKARQLSQMKVGSIQTTIDGPRSLHDKRRILKYGRPTFDKLLEIIAECSEYIRIVLRINIDKEVANNFEELFEDIRPLSKCKNVNVYPGRLACEVTNACSSIESSCLDIRDHALVYPKFYQLAVKNGFPLSWYPSRSSGGCCATSVNSMVIQPNGNLCRCWSQVGSDDESYGNISSGIVKEENLLKWLVYNPFEYESCLKCEFFPICASGCPARRIPQTTEYMKGNNSVNPCAPEKYHIKEMLNQVYKGILAQQEKY